MPSRLVATSGRVRDAEHLLVDDFRDMRFGLPDCTAAFCDRKLADETSTVELDLRVSTGL